MAELNTFADLRSALNKPAPVQAPISGTVGDVPAAPPAVAVIETTPVVAEPVAAPVAEPPAAPVADPATPVAPAPKGPPKRFADLTRERDAERARAATLEAEVARLKTISTTPLAQPVENLPELLGKPVPLNAADFADKPWAEYDAAKTKYTIAQAKWEVKNEAHQERVQAQQNAANAEWQKVDQTWKQQYDAAMEADETFEQQVNAVAKVVAPKGIHEVIKESPVATEIVKALYADPARLEALGKMTVASAAREIGKIEASIQKGPAPVAAKALPAPPAVVGGVGDNSPKIKPLGELPMSEFREKVKSQLKPGRVGLAGRKMTIG